MENRKVSCASTGSRMPHFHTCRAILLLLLLLLLLLVEHDNKGG